MQDHVMASAGARILTLTRTPNPKLSQYGQKASAKPIPIPGRLY